MTGQLYASGEGWIGGGIPSVETGIHDLFSKARRRVVMSAYSITGGAFDLPESWIGEATDRNVEIILVINRCAGQHQTVLRSINAIARRTGLVQLWDYAPPTDRDLHAKAIVADERIALIGSSNLSGNGLLRNHELAVMVEGEPARLAADLIVRLTHSTNASRRF